MDINAILDNNGYDIKNPNYNPNTKKGKLEPPTLKTQNIGESHPFITSAYEQSKTDAFMFNVNDYEKYINAGINLNKKEDTKHWDKLLSEYQSNWSKAINALGQTIVSEVGLGTLKGASDFIDSIGQAVGLSDHDYSNPVSQFLEEKQKEFEEWAPVYADPDKNIMNGGLTDFGWWMSNIPSIASTLTLLIPSTMAVKGLSLLNKVNKINKVSKFTNKAARAIANPVAHSLGRSGFSSKEMGLFAENAANGAIMRTMENYQEARQTYNDTYIDMSNSLKSMSDEEYNNFLNRNSQYLQDNKVDINDRDAVAKQIAKSSADRTFQLDWANVLFDVYQIYSLRNLLSRAPKFNQNASTRKAQREVIRTAGMTEEQAAAELAKDSKLEKVGYWIADRLIGSGRIIKSELSEGIEEAVNFVAQQEGTHLGKYILTGEEGSSKELDFWKNLGPMHSRILKDYVKDAGLWDSAFWGVLGGVIFQAGGSKLNRISQTIKDRQEAKKSNNKNNEETKEAKVTPHWWALSQTSETERMLTEIKGRNIKLNSLRERLQKINSGKNPFIKKEDGKEEEISSPLEERVLREKAYNEYLDDLIITARNNGTLNMLVSYLENENVKNAITNVYQSTEETANLTEEAKKQLKFEAEQQAASAVERAKHIDRLYVDELNHISDMADNIGDKEGNYLPAEYIQMITSANVRRKLNVEQYDKLKELYEEDTSRIENVLGERFDRNINYRELVKLRSTISKLSELTAFRKELKQLQEESPTVSRQFEIDELDKKINSLKRNTLDLSTDASFANAIYAMQIANSAIREYSADKKNYRLTVDNLDLISNIDEFLQDNLGSIFKEFGVEQRSVSTDAVIGQLTKLNKEMNYVLPVNAENKLKDSKAYLDNLDPNLLDNYTLLSEIELNKLEEIENLAETKQEIQHYVSFINNVENIARNQVIQEAFENLKEVQKNHLDDVDVFNLVNNIYTNDIDFIADSQSLTDEERNKIKEAAKVLNLANVKNEALYDTLFKTMYSYKRTLRQVKNNDDQNTEKTVITEEEETQKSSASQNSNVEQEKQGLNNQSGEQEKQDTTQNSGELEEIENQNKQKSVTLSYNGNIITSTAVNDDTSDSDKNIPINDLGNDNFELDFISKGTNVNASDVSNNQLFDINTQPMDGGVVTKNPVVKINNNGNVEVISKGVVGNPQTSSTGEQNDIETQKYIARINNSNDINEIDSICNEALDKGISEEDIMPVYNARVKEIKEVNLGPTTPIIGADPANYVPKIAKKARETAIRIKNGEKLSYDDFINELSDVKEEIGNDDEFNRLTKEHWNRQIERLKTSYPEAVDGIITAILNSDTTEDIPGTNLGYRFKTSFKREVEKLVKAYLKDIKQKKINGKYYISLENLLRFCNGEFKNNENASIMYNIMANYLTSDEAKDIYVLEESKDEISSYDFLDKVKTPLQERIEKAIKEENHRINTIEVEDKSVFDEINEGDELKVDKQKDRIYFSFNGKNLGYIGIPKVVNDTYQSPYKYFLFKIRPLGKDTYYSDISKIFKAILNTNTDNKELQEIYNAAFDKSIDLSNNKLWKEIKEKYTINTINKEIGKEYDNVNEEMLKVIRTMASFSIKYGNSDKAVDVWFNTLAQEYIAAYNIAKASTTPKIKIDAITDGFLIRAVDKLTDEDGRIIQEEVNKLPLASEAIGDNYKGRVSIAVGSRQEVGTIDTVVKKENNKIIIPASNSLPGVGYSNTFVVFPVANGKTAYAQAYPILAKELKRGSDASNIVSAFVEEIYNYLNDIANNPNDLQLFKDLQDFLFEAINYKNSTTPLFHMDNCEKIDRGDNRGTHLGTNGKKGVRRDLRIFCNPGKDHIIQIDGKEIKINNNTINDIKNEIRKFLGDTLQFNISSNYIASDNNKRNQIEGLAYRDNEGKFVIKIGDKIFTFDSYNDFIINNDLIRVNTKPNESGNNFTRTSSNPNVRYKIVTSSPVEDSNTVKQTRHQTSKDIQNNAIAIMQSGMSNKAEAIANLIFDKDVVDLLVKNDLLPTTLVYDETFNDKNDAKNASFNKTTGITTIGPKFISILSDNNLEYRKQAIRKLIHEKLHNILHSDGNEHFIKDIESIYDEFCKYLDDAEFSKPILDKYLKKIKLNKSLDEYYNGFKKYKYLSKQENTSDLIKYLETLKKEELYKYVDTFKIIDKKFVDNNSLEELAKYINKLRSIEEFLVDSLTSVELANYLNNITGLSKVNMRKLKRDTLLNKIMRILAKLMGINIKNDSLYAQEFEAIRNAIDSTAEITEQIDNKNKQDDIKQEQGEVQQKIEPKKDEPKKDKDNDEDENLNLYQELSNDYNFDEYGSTTIEEYNEELPSELQEIKDAAIADGTFMKAPNGNPTNLTERQWLQVRTKEFKDWFGDWENNSANASKVVDENGEPLVVYHGSNEYGFNIFDPSKSDDKISLFASSSKWIASTYTSFKPLENALVRKALLKGNAIDLIKNEDWKSLEKLINSIIDFNLPRPIEGGYPLPYGNEKVLDEILTIKKELNKPNLTEEEHLSLLADLTKAEDEYYYSRNYTFKVKKTTFHDKTRIKISIDDSYNKEFFSSHYIEEGVIFRGSPKELIESLTFDTKVYDLFLNIKNPLILDDQVNEFGHANNWNGLYFSPAAKEVQNTDLWGNKMLGTHKQTKTRDVAEYAKKNNYDGVIFKQIADRGGYPGYQSLNPMTDADFLYEDMHIGEDSFNDTNKLESDIFIAFNSNNIKSATDNIGAFSTKDDNIYNSDTIEEYEMVASIGDYIQSYSPEDRAEIAREINNGNISIKCK